MPPASIALVPSDVCAKGDVDDELQKHVGPRNFDHWFRNKTTFQICDDELIVGVGSPFLLNWMQKQFREAILKTAQVLLGPSARIRFEVDANLAMSESRREPKSSQKTRSTRARAAAADNGKRPQPDTTRRRFASLSEFVAGPGNELALTATRQVCEAPGARFNPLYLHGGVGLGKTHLLEAIYGKIRREFPSLNVTFLTAEAFANYFTQALREHTLPSFRQRFRGVDVLLVDDVDFFDSKRVIQEEFLHTFKQLESHGRQIVVTADRHPRLLTKLSEELTTRFVSGLVCRIETPDQDTRRRIVESKAARMNVPLTPEVLTFIAQRFKNNVRELEGALNCLQTYHYLTKKRVGISAARQVLADLERDCIRIVRIADIERAVCTMFGLEPEDLKSNRRTRSVSQPRMLAMFLARKHTQAAYSEIGAYFGGRNHSTVMSAEKKVQSLLSARSPITVTSQTWALDDLVETIEQQLLAG